MYLSTSVSTARPLTQDKTLKDTVQKWMSILLAAFGGGVLFGSRKSAMLAAGGTRI